MNGLVFPQSPSAKSVQMDPDWEKIRDAQVQMLRKKEAELDRIKEELLTRAQPQAQVQTGLPEVEAEFKKREAGWLQKSDRYENEVTLLKLKVEEQKSEVATLRIQLNTISKGQLNKPQEKFVDQGSVVSSDLDQRKAQLELQEKQMQDKQAEWELHIKQSQQAKEELFEIEKEKVEFQNKVSSWEAAQVQANQKNEAERLKIETERHVLEKGRSDLAAEMESFNLKLTELKRAHVQAQELLTRETAIQSKDQQLTQKQVDLDNQEKRIVVSLRQMDEEKRLWLSQKMQTDGTLTEKLAGVEAQFAQLQEAKKTSDLDRAIIAKQITNLQGQLKTEKSLNEERKSNWEKREQELLSSQRSGDSRIVELQSRLAKEQIDFGQKEVHLKLQLDGLSQKLAQSEAQIKAADLRLRDQSLREERTQFTRQAQNNFSGGASHQISSEALELRRKLAQSQSENESWRQSKRQVEQKWAEFVNKEMQYQMQISELQKENQILQQKVAAKKT